MRIATWNVNRVQSRLQHLLAWLGATRPDVVALQELKCREADFPRMELERAGYGCLVVGQPSWNGVALLARDAEPLPVRRVLPGDAADREARYVEAAVRGVLIASIYLPNGNPWPGPKFDAKMAWFARLQRHAATLLASGAPVVLAGDFNVIPTDADARTPASWRDNALMQPEPRAAFADMLAQGWQDAIATRPPEGISPWTFWDHRRNRWPRDSGLRIDHLLLSPAVAARLQRTGIDRALRGLPEPSDHAPAWIELA